MSKEIIAKLNDEELEAVCGGKSPGESISEGYFGEMGKFLFAIVAVPVTAILSTFAVWGANRLTKKLDKKLDEREAINAAIAAANATTSTNA